MPRQSHRKPSQARVYRHYHPARLAVSALVQVYELLLPSLRRPLPAPPPAANDQRFSPPARRAAARPGG
jgi:hypothetical protein